RATRETYAALGFKCGLEIHQQLLTRSKLFCRCPAGIYHHRDDFDAEVIRHMRPTLSEMGEYDGTALMEKRTKKNIIYRIKDRTACTYEIDDTPPFKIDREALEIAIEVALLLKTNIVGELHITRKQYLDGSIPTGFQRTAIVGIEGEIPLAARKVRIIQLSVEEDSCREVSDVAHDRTYTTDRLGMPLIETVTYPDMLTPDEAAEAAQYLRYLARSTGHVRTGIGAAREDVNVSITGGTRVEIKGVAKIKWIPELTHNEAFRQRALLEIARILRERVGDPAAWRISQADLPFAVFEQPYAVWASARQRGGRLAVINLPDFKGILSFFTQPGQMFAHELEGRVKVIACLERPNIVHSEQPDLVLSAADWAAVYERLQPGPGDAQVLVWGPPADVATAIETIEERCRMAFDGVPNETRKALPDGTTIFERVLPGPDRMYPDTDSAPLSVSEELIERLRRRLPVEVAERMRQLSTWQVPADAHRYLLARNLTPLIERIASDWSYEPRWVGKVLGHGLKNIERENISEGAPLDYERLYGLFAFVKEQGLDREIIKAMLPAAYRNPQAGFAEILERTGFRRRSEGDLLGRIPGLVGQFRRHRRSGHPEAAIRWAMGVLRPEALGNLSFAKLRKAIAEEVRV
ncbi:MAG TPA: Glu-tRNA(Gln) amidotransferase subunit GatE, partial [candidate division Zixibacteria bacterium]|nr:Glu-tRNA(Gln) amidotransferase subunit GatE [candidate division Zixibacteria bacterium]